MVSEENTLMMSNRLRMGISLIVIFSLFVSTVGAAYIFSTSGLITVDHGSLYIDGMTVDNYINTLLVAFSGFDQSLNTTDDVEFNSVTTPSITLGGDTRIAWPAAGSFQSANKTGYDWYVWKTGSDYYFLGDNATLLIDTDFDARFNGIMVDCSYDASFYLEEATYSYDTDLLLEGTGSAYTRMPIIKGVGIGRTILTPAAGVNGITLKTGISAQIYDLTINMASTGAVAYGIYGDPTGGSTAYTECGGFRTEIDNIEIKGGVSGGAGVYMVNSEWCIFGDMRVSMNSGCHGMLFRNLATADFMYNENTFKGFITITITGSNTVGLGFYGANVDKACNQMEGTGYFWIRRNTGSAGTNTTGLKLKYAHYFDLGRFHFEECATMVNVSYSYGGVIDGGKAFSLADDQDTTLFWLGPGCYNLLFQHFHLNIGSFNSVEWVYDTRDSAYGYNAYYDITLHAGVGGVFTQTITATTNLDLIRHLGGGTFP